jgi:hypothetical protein
VTLLSDPTHCIYWSGHRWRYGLFNWRKEPIRRCRWCGAVEVIKAYPGRWG